MASGIPGERILKLYTKVGDKGETGLFGGETVPKDHPRVVAYGEIDETNAALGVAIESIEDAESVERLRTVQSDLFAIGAILATPKPNEHTPTMNKAMIVRLEGWIDDAHAEPPALTNFILPGGSESAARLQLARTVCRRAERTIVTLLAQENLDELVLIYLNRLSDLLFALARLMNHRAGAKDILWSPGSK